MACCRFHACWMYNSTHLKLLYEIYELIRLWIYFYAIRYKNDRIRLYINIYVGQSCSISIVALRLCCAWVLWHIATPTNYSSTHCHLFAKKITIYRSINTPHMGKSSIALFIPNDSLCSRIFRCKSMNTYLYSVLL